MIKLSSVTRKSYREKFIKEENISPIPSHRQLSLCCIMRCNRSFSANRFPFHFYPEENNTPVVGFTRILKIVEKSLCGDGKARADKGNFHVVWDRPSKTTVYIQIIAWRFLKVKYDIKAEYSLSLQSLRCGTRWDHAGVPELLNIQLEWQVKRLQLWLLIGHRRFPVQALIGYKTLWGGKRLPVTLRLLRALLQRPVPNASSTPSFSLSWYWCYVRCPTTPQKIESSIAALHRTSPPPHRRVVEMHSVPEGLLHHRTSRIGWASQTEPFLLNCIVGWSERFIQMIDSHLCILVAPGRRDIFPHAPIC